VRDVAAASEAARQGDRGLIENVSVRLESGTQVTGAFVNAGFVFKTDGPGGVGSVPVLGEHSRNILSSLGYSEQETDALIDAHVVRDRT
jgi:crotonobetainyl-CoA:carnitine CoA-transferase CaiB-like acyl-CoA transferase